ncbi:SDR family oxidoreductase [Actinokineospora enzanensis]|uniref:SDR family oxidoreductase n=1 Tax=Actinokineospora enzanensis TaxID=155975 RepID=UPI000371C2FD|nr:SDR family oxidoreductase [Actinokineospora enzanensis]
MAVELEGATALVTGGTGGVGRAVAAALAGRGAEVLLGYARDEKAAETAVAELTAAGGKVSAVRADVGNPAEVADLYRGIAARYGRLDILVHAAAAMTPMSAVDPDVEACERDLATVLGPLLHGAKDLVALLRPGGRVIAVSSTGARRVVPGYVGQGIAKAALESAVRYLAVQLAPSGIAVNVVSPGKVACGEPDEIAKRVAGRSPLKRLVTAVEVADVVALLCRPEAAHLHGQVLTVDGGLSLLA